MTKPTNGSCINLEIERPTALSDSVYRIDINSIRRAFPPGIEPSPLLLDFAAWLEGRPWGSVGCFDLVGSVAEAAPIVDGGPLRDNFACSGGCPKVRSLAPGIPQDAT
jgi:hypothetical protein